LSGIKSGSDLSGLAIRSESEIDKQDHLLSSEFERSTSSPNRGACDEVADGLAEFTPSIKQYGYIKDPDLSGIKSGSDLSGLAIRSESEIDMQDHLLSSDGLVPSDLSGLAIRSESEEEIHVNAEIYLVETAFDDLIIFKALQNFFTAKYRKNDDNFASKMTLYDKKFRDEITSLAYSYDVLSSFYNDENDPKPKPKNPILRIVL
jgi:hypothetical protein